MRNLRVLFVLVIALCFALNSFGEDGKMEKKNDFPKVNREFRGAWVATVANIDWPSKPGLTVDEQKAEAIAILDKIKSMNMNAVVFQVRPQCDALYKSDLEPWSYFLTGKQGQAPEPFYDPLEFWVAESHSRGLELHAWFNPYRANHPGMKSEISEKSIVKAKPELVVKLGDKGYYWMDPALKEVQDHSIAVVMDVVKRYDVDGIHFDDYFYPYSSYNDEKDFPDDKSWDAYKKTGGTMTREDWRRDAVNKFIERLYNEIKKEKPYVKFGISPFGIWRPGYPASIEGLDQYNALYADAKLWLNKGWVDYLTPQLYWAISKIPQSFPVLLGWWESENTMNRHLWPGMSIGGASKPEKLQETINQIMVTRGMISGGPGNIFFSMKTLSNNDGGLADKLAEGPYKIKAISPAYGWLDSEAPAAPKFAAAKEADAIKIKIESDDKAFYYIVYTKESGKWKYDIFAGSMKQIEIPKAAAIEEVAVSAVDRCFNEGEKTLQSVK